MPRVTYAQFRTGLTFREVRRMLWVDNPDPATWRHKSRGVVLGFWRSLKLAMFEEYERRLSDEQDQLQADEMTRKRAA